MNTDYHDYIRRQVAAIHVLKHQLGLDDGTYRDLLERVTGKRSAAALDAAGRSRALNELRRLAGDGSRHARQAVPPTKDAPRAVREDAAAMIGKVGALLADANRGWAYAHGMARKMFGVARIEWCTAEQLHRLVAALEYDKRRRRKEAGS